MAKVTLTIEGEPFEVRQAIEELFGGLSAGGLLRTAQEPVPAVEIEVGSPQEGHPFPDQMSEHELDLLWDELSEGAKRVLTEIARYPDGCDLATVAEDLGIDAKGVGGRLSSLGSALNRVGIERERHPLIRETIGGQLIYRMVPHLASFISRQMREDDLIQQQEEESDKLTELYAQLADLSPEQEDEREKIENTIAAVRHRLEYINAELEG